MKGAELQITAKLRSEIHGKEARFIFKVSENPDDLWRAIFEKEACDMPPGMNHHDFSVSFEAESVILTCLPVNLESKYKHLKETIRRTNARYETARNAAFEAAKKREEDQRRAQESAKSAQDGIQSRFDKLEL